MYRFRKDLQNRPEMKIEVSPRKHMMCLNESSLDPFHVLKDEIFAQITDHFQANRYLSPITQDLKEALAQYVGHGIKGSQILFGNGADEMLYFMFTAVREDNNSFALSLAPSYFDYKTYSASVGLKIQTLNLNEDFNFSVEDYVKIARDPYCKLAIICNPNNPTGNMIPDKKIIYILQNLDIPVIVDETYFEFSNKTFADLIQEYPNLIIVRSFSKSFSSAGLRFGYIISSEENCKEINKVMPVFHSNLLTQNIAFTLLKNKDVFAQHNLNIISERNELFQKMSEIKQITVKNTHTNFLIFTAGDRSQELFNYLLDKEISIRSIGGHPILKDYLRVSISSPEDNQLFLNAVSDFFK